MNTYRANTIRKNEGTETNATVTLPIDYKFSDEAVRDDIMRGYPYVTEVESRRGAQAKKTEII